ncbi:MAG: hypothetical protein JETT_1861 [Candidatus Jettenia ecosi]|uniref:Uncharacterized protein n=1 Tax=Candidatus Jettenia ecosi TaxID=2494326 RepID=A0A533QAW2_9BACT|nr:MAG: hypothetical protein JETT_1861 [Candidatus Jettenia ecosi]
MDGGYKFLQGLIPIKMHRDFTLLARELRKSRSMLLREAVEFYLKNQKGKSSHEGDKQ